MHASAASDPATAPYIRLPTVDPTPSAAMPPALRPWWWGVQHNEGVHIMTVGESPLFTDGYYDMSLKIGDELRAMAAVHLAKLPDEIRVWVICQYEHARAALADSRLSHDAHAVARVIRQQLTAAGKPDELSRMHDPHMLNMDDPEHAGLRSRVAAKFTRARVEAMRPRIQQLTNELLDAIPPHRPADLVEHLAFPLPLTVICELLGVPEGQREQLRDWTTDLMRDVQERVVPASQAMAHYFSSLIEDKRTAPSDDLLSALVHIADDADQLTQDELMSLLFLLFVAGHETTTNLISNSIRWLLRDPEQWRLLHDEPGLLPGAVEELLRFDSPVRMTPYRVTTQDVDYGGVIIPAGELVYVSLQSANRDSGRFDHGDQLDLRRDARGHLSFGHGIHHCLGAHLGRLEAQIALGELTRRFPNARLAVAEQDLTRRHSAIMNGYTAVPVVLNG